MRKLLVLLPLMCECSPVGALGTGPTNIQWKGWMIQSSENLYHGRSHTSYPLTYLFDGDPRTAWVFSGTSNCEKYRLGEWGSRYAILLTPDKPVTIDSLWIMNGYNRRRELFYRNNRIVQIRLSVDAARYATGGADGKVIKVVNLSDRMGWHKISIPRQSVRSLFIQCTGIRKGRDNDVCISELALLNRGHKINMRMPQAVIFGVGGEDDGCQENSKAWNPDDTYLMSRSGRFIAVDGMADDQGRSAVWSSSGRYVSSVESVRGFGQLWVADALTARVIYRRRLRRLDEEQDWHGVEDLRWKSEHTVEVQFAANDKRVIKVR